MRQDKHITEDHKLLPKQIFFSNCWFNMVHEVSLDSYRVRTMNPQNILRELLVMFQPHANDSDRSRVAKEANLILQDQLILSSLIFAPTVKEICAIISAAQVKDKNITFGKDTLIVQVFIRELLENIKKSYISTCLQWLEKTLIADVNVVKSDQVYRDIEQVTGNLLSTVLDNGWSLESLFQLHKFILFPAQKKEDKKIFVEYKFSETFASLKTRLEAEPKSYTVVFAIQDVSQPEIFPKAIAGIVFDPEPPKIAETSNDYAKSYAKKAGNKLFATVTVKAQDGREAGRKASDKISHILDLVRFEYERKNIALKEQFLLEKEGGRYTRLTIPKIVPNPESAWDPSELEEFVNKLEDLVSSGTLPDDAKDRIYSAFRLYRVGADTRNFENKLMNWWTAVEYLVKGNNGGGAIGDGVESALVPTLSLTYLSKHLTAFRAIFADMKIEIFNPHSKELIQVRTLTLQEFYGLLKENNMEQAIKNANGMTPFLWMKLEPFITAIKKPEEMAKLLKKHEEKLGWNIQRIYRARCDIVHSAQRTLNAALLCANLEFYLKGVLSSFLSSLHDIPTLRDPKEFFERQKYISQRIQNELINKNDSLLVSILK